MSDALTPLGDGAHTLHYKDLGDGTIAPIVAVADVGSHVYGYTNGQLTTDAWTVNGITKTKTYTYTNGVLSAESAWA